jgi:hypothetical protein
MTFIQYTLEEFINKSFQGIDYKLPESIVSIIQTLSTELNIHDTVDSTQSSGHPRKTTHPKTVTKVVDNQQWNRSKPFKTTSIEQKTGTEKTLNDIRYCLNNLSDVNYQKQLKNIVDIIQTLVPVPDTMIHSILEFIRDSASTNKLNSALYAKLTGELLLQFPDNTTAFTQELGQFTERYFQDLSTIQYVDSSQDFDLFCAYNKANDKRKGFATFLVFLTSEGLIPYEDLYDSMNRLLDLTKIWIDTENKYAEVDEVSDNLAIQFKLLTSGHATEGLSILRMRIAEFAAYKAKEHRSLSARTVFKFMEMNGV